MPAAPPPPPFNRYETVWLSVLLAVQAAAGLAGIRNYGYVGQDFPQHYGQILNFPDDFSYHLTNPPGLYWLGSLVRNHLSSAHFLEVLALLMLALNTAALALLFRILREMIRDRWLRCAAAAVIALVPFRVLHSVVTAADVFTVPTYALAAWLTLRLAEDLGATRRWVALGATLTAGMFLKYTAIGLLPPIALVLGAAVWRQRRSPGTARTLACLGVALAVPAAAFAWEKAAGRYVNPAEDPGGWLKSGEPSVMRPRDLLFVQASDWNLLTAPEYFRDKVYENRKYSYPGLLYLGTFSDVSNFFQRPVKPWAGNPNDRPVRERTAWSQPLHVWSMHLSLPLAVAAVLGALGCGGLALVGLVRGASPLLPAASTLTLLALGMHAPILIGLLRLTDPYVPGFWLPRLAMPSVTTFLGLGFVLADAMLAARASSGGSAARTGPPVVFAYAAACAAVYAGLLLP